MFNIFSDSKGQPITSKQAAFLGKLLTRHGKDKYQAAKRRAGISEETTILRLSRWQASRLIDELKGAGNG